MAPAQALDQSVGLRLALTWTAAVVSEAATFPIDTTKARLQLEGEGGQTGVRRGAFGMAVNVVKEEGIVGLYRGLSPAVLRHTFSSSIRIVTYEQLRDGLHKGGNQNDISTAKKALIGGAAGMFGQMIASPTDLVKVRMQSDGLFRKMGQPPRYTGVVDAFSKVVKTEGVTGLWRGVGPNGSAHFS